MMNKIEKIKWEYFSAVQQVEGTSEFGQVTVMDVLGMNSMKDH